MSYNPSNVCLALLNKEICAPATAAVQLYVVVGLNPRVLCTYTVTTAAQKLDYLFEANGRLYANMISCVLPLSHPPPLPVWFSILIYRAGGQLR